jgi:protein TonB
VATTLSTQLPTASAAAVVTAESRKVEYLYNPPPDYPRRARRLGQEGEVVIRTRVLPSGESDQLVLKRSSGYALLDEAAMEAVRKWRFLPARRGDEQIVSWVEIPVRFRLER